MILCAGEILADMIGAEKDGNFSYERKAGGAPFNVACAIQKFGGKSAFVGCVGKDIIGDFLLRFAQEKKLDEVCIAQDEGRNTTLAFVELDKNGERSFCFYRKNTADYHLPEVPERLLERANIVHIGSLMISESCGAEYAERLAKRAHAQGKKVSFDVNYRTDIFRNRESALFSYKKILALADIVKFSEDEIEVFGEDYLENELADRLICISLGGKGSEWRWKGQRKQIPSVAVKPIDTTGAGDAFYAGVLTNLDGVKEYTEEILDGAFRFGNVCGALNTLGKGAIDCLPDLAAIRQRL
jgi:fructokinase